MNLCDIEKKSEFDASKEHFGTLDNGRDNSNLIKYANHVVDIMKTSHKHNKRFLNILDSMFLLEDNVYIVHPN